MASLFWPLVVMSQLFGITMMAVMVIWLQHHVGGFTWGGTGGYHPLLLTTALVFLFGEALLSFRTFSRCRLPYLGQKAIHATVHTVIIILVIVGLRAATIAKDGEKVHVHHYSMHSWLGILTVVLFCAQFIAGCVYYGAERFLREDHPLRAHYPQIHVFFGIFMLALSIGSCLTGLNELAIYQILGYSKGVVSGAVGNIYGLLMVFFGGTIVFITTRPEFKTETLQTVTSDSRDQTGYQEALPGVQVVSDDGLKMELRDSD
ncbi:cytochrome b561-like [Asterias rubens]|uniref:cytochrome b561-like n=1 Tax=Asterias rubens TaxID=7604 RepID=UPI0014557016|nr:cytochrome b561-like [Asterias rubens]